MASRLTNLIVLTLILTGSAVVAYAQPELPDASVRSSRQRKDDMPMGVKEMMAKQKTERDKKDHQELLERGDEALRIAKQLETSFAENKAISSQDRARLESLERLVAKIRKGLGGDDDSDDEDARALQPAEQPRPSTLEEAFQYLQTTTVKLVDELKKTTRFSISAVAIQTSNTVLKLVRFLRLKK